MNDANSRHRAREILSSFLGVSLPSFAIVHHKDGNPQNNKLSNLEIVTRQEHAKIHRGKNQRHNRSSTFNRLLPKGITYDQSRGNFKCHIRVGVDRYQGRVQTLEEAVRWRNLMEAIYWE